MSSLNTDLVQALSLFDNKNIVPQAWQVLLNDDPINHQPAVTVHNFSSKGRTWRIKGQKSGKIHYPASDLEYKIFSFLDRHPIVKAIREQFGHPLELTKALAHQLGINHPPQNSAEKLPLSTDFIVDLDNVNFPHVAIYAKYAKDLENPRTIEKLLLEAASLASANILMWIITEKEIEQDIIRSFEWIGSFDDEIDLVKCFEVARYYYAYLLKFPNTKLTTALFELDKAEGEEPGTSIGKVKKLISIGLFSFDFKKHCNFLMCCDLIISAPWDK